MKTRHVILALAVLVGWLPAFAQAQAPVITRQPTNQVAALGSFGNASFSAMATGLFTPSFQWWVNGHPAKEGGSSGSGGGIIETTLALYNVIWQDAGDYTVVFSNALGTVTSVVATLSINPQAPAITIQPTNQSAFLTDDVVFRAAALGFPPPAYQWRFGPDPGNDLPGATGSTLTLSDAQAADAGHYRVVVSNASGSVTSVVAILRVLLPPALATAQFSGGSFQVSSPSATGLNYVLESKERLDDPVWIPIVSAPGTGALLTLSDTAPWVPARFYRVRVE